MSTKAKAAQLLTRSQLINNRFVCPCPSHTRTPVFRAPCSASSPLSAPVPFNHPLQPPRPLPAH
eukprot:1195625-Prorocentrum_minimum.AAC.1